MALSVLIDHWGPDLEAEEAGCLLDNDGKEGVLMPVLRKPEIQLAWASPSHPSSGGQRASGDLGVSEIKFFVKC